MDYLKFSFKNWNNFSGRSSRVEFFLFQIIYILVFYYLLFGLLDYDHSNFLIDVLYLLPIVYLAITNLSITVRRLHDINFSGWWVLLINLLMPLSYLFLLIKSYEGSNKWGNLPKY